MTQAKVAYQKRQLRYVFQKLVDGHKSGNMKLLQLVIIYRKTKYVFQFEIASNKTRCVNGCLDDGTPDVDAFDGADEQDDLWVVVLVLLVECNTADYHDQRQQTQQAQAPKQQSENFLIINSFFTSSANDLLVCAT